MALSDFKLLGKVESAASSMVRDTSICQQFTGLKTTARGVWYISLIHLSLILQMWKVAGKQDGCTYALTEIPVASLTRTVRITTCSP